MKHLKVKKQLREMRAASLTQEDMEGCTMGFQEENIGSRSAKGTGCTAAPRAENKTEVVPYLHAKARRLFLVPKSATQIKIQITQMLPCLFNNITSPSTNFAACIFLKYAVTSQEKQTKNT